MNHAPAAFVSGTQQPSPRESHSWEAQTSVRAVCFWIYLWARAASGVLNVGSSDDRFKLVTKEL
jgi:hypothetical protein